MTHFCQILNRFICMPNCNYIQIFHQNMFSDFRVRQMNTGFRRQIDMEQTDIVLIRNSKILRHFQFPQKLQS